MLKERFQNGASNHEEQLSTSASQNSLSLKQSQWTASQVSVAYRRNELLNSVWLFLHVANELHAAGFCSSPFEDGGPVAAILFWMVMGWGGRGNISFATIDSLMHVTSGWSYRCFPVLVRGCSIVKCSLYDDESTLKHGWQIFQKSRSQNGEWEKLRMRDPQAPPCI